MNVKDKRQARYGLVRDMVGTVEVIGRFDPACVRPFVEPVRRAGSVLMSGEGSSRILPAKNAIARARRWGSPLRLAAEGGRQAAEYDLEGWAVFGASNSGRTREVVELLRAQSRRQPCYGLTATPGSLLTWHAHLTHVLGCGQEEAVAATKSVVEQALFYHALLAAADRRRGEMAFHRTLPAAFARALGWRIPSAWVARAAAAPRIYFAGRNDGVAEELALKTNEITRKPSAYLEGTYAIHGVEEAMDPEDVVVLVDPFREEIAKFEKCLRKEVGLTVLAISSRDLPFPTLRVPACRNAATYLQLAMGWNFLVAVGLALGLDLDKPLRARKVGNEALAG